MRCLSVSIDIVNAINAKDTIRLYRKGENMRKFDENLLEKSEIMDTLLSPFGENAPKKRLLVVDYKEQGVDKHINLAAYQYKGMTDQDLISSLIIEYAKQDKLVMSVGEVDSNCQPVQQLYLAPGYLKECMEEIMKFFKKGR